MTSLQSSQLDSSCKDSSNPAALRLSLSHCLGISVISVWRLYYTIAVLSQLILGTRLPCAADKYVCKHESQEQGMSVIAWIARILWGLLALQGLL